MYIGVFRICVGEMNASAWVAGMYEKEEYTSDPVWREFLTGMDQRIGGGRYEDEEGGEYEWRPWSEEDLEGFRKWDECIYETWKDVQESKENGESRDDS